MYRTPRTHVITKTKKLLTGLLLNLFIINLVIADTSPSYKIDMSTLNGGGQVSGSANYKINDTTVGFVNGSFGNSAGYGLGSGLVYLELWCGNGILELGEECDDGNTVAGDGCSSLCATEPTVCGNTVLEAGEQCDDGNRIDGDGCSSSCALEIGSGGGYVTPYSYHACGNARREETEECDDGNRTAGDGCDSQCLLEPSEKSEGPFEIPSPEEEDLSDRIETSEEEEKPPAEEVGYPRKPHVITIYSKPEKRVRINNWGVPGRIIFYHTGKRKIEAISEVTLNDKGWAVTEELLLPDGTYNVAFKGMSHLTKIKYGVPIDEYTEMIDFTFSETFQLIAGDVHESKDDFVNGLDISAAVNFLYTSDLNADLNRDGFVNGLDISIVVENIYKSGEKMRI